MKIYRFNNVYHIYFQERGNAFLQFDVKGIV